MPKVCANISFLWKDLSVPNRVRAAAAAGFGAVEILFPYDDPMPEVQSALAQTGLSLALINCPPPNYTGGRRGFAAVPEDRDRFRQDFRRALRYAKALKVEHLHVMAGVAMGPEAEATFIENLNWACDHAPGQSILIEPINAEDMPGYFLSDFDVAARVIDAVGARTLGLQFDAYHAHRITGDLAGTWAAHGARARHVQVADHPGRNEPGTGEIDLSGFFDQLKADGYDGWISGEYAPKADPEAGLDWIRQTS
ncbi:hydroxypyruvate isomerase family protein [Pseudooceanicola onchidii]|uniref:hydroxypyruvate isomerase family protein n=1 Tax=Pseudooceanicola onchidii TaxID=2562279 RepID=UPI0010AA0E99|nr:TIM barrel protein [Pseudooceanicola onchidii]